MKYERRSRIEIDATPADLIDLEDAFVGRNPAEIGGPLDEGGQPGGAVRADLHTAMAIRKLLANEWSLDDACIFIRSFAKGNKL